VYIGGMVIVFVYCIFIVDGSRRIEKYGSNVIKERWETDNFMGKL
jgi:hypothetical protein